MKKRSVLRLAAAICIAGMLPSCYYDVEQNLYPDDFQPCDTASVTYSGTIAPLIQQNCLVCHSAAAANGGVVLATHPDVLAYALNGSLAGTMAHEAGYSPMPKNLPQLPGCEVDKVRIWIAAGAPND